MAKVETGCEAILRRIAEQEARIVRQKRLIEGLAANGTTSANARARFVALVVPAMTFAIQQAPMHRAMDEVFRESPHHDGGNRHADKSDHVEHAIVPWLKCWADRYST